MRGAAMSRYNSIVLATLLSCAALAAFTPAQARFLQTDPVGYKDDIDLYTYGQNDPTNRTDPTGMRSRLFVDDNSHTITVVVPVTVAGGTSMEQVQSSITGITQNVTDPATGTTWHVKFEVANGTLTDQKTGNPYTNLAVYDIDKNSPTGGPTREADAPGFRSSHGVTGEFGTDPSDKQVAHELGGHGSGLDDVYNTATRQSNPNLPGNLMNNDGPGTKLTWGQVKTMESEESGNEVFHQPERTWTQWFHDHIW
jgi:hypothetical protein